MGFRSFWYLSGGGGRKISGETGGGGCKNVCDSNENVPDPPPPPHTPDNKWLVPYNLCSDEEFRNYLR